MRAARALTDNAYVLMVDTKTVIRSFDIATHATIINYIYTPFTGDIATVSLFSSNFVQNWFQFEVSERFFAAFPFLYDSLLFRKMILHQKISHFFAPIKLYVVWMCVCYSFCHSK